MPCGNSSWRYIEGGGHFTHPHFGPESPLLAGLQIVGVCPYYMDLVWMPRTPITVMRTGNEHIRSHILIRIEWPLEGSGALTNHFQNALLPACFLENIWVSIQGSQRTQEHYTSKFRRFFAPYNSAEITEILRQSSFVL